MAKPDVQKGDLQLSPEEMKRRLLLQQQENAIACSREIEAILKKRGLKFQVIQVLVNGNPVRTEIQYVPDDSA